MMFLLFCHTDQPFYKSSELEALNMKFSMELETNHQLITFF